MLGGVYLTAFVISALAENFGARKDFDRAFSLGAYSYTPMFVGGVFYLLPSLSWLASLAGLYGLYLLYAGLPAVMKAPAEKQSQCFVISLIVMVAVSAALSFILAILRSFSCTEERRSALRAWAIPIRIMENDWKNWLKIIAI
ncbi:MAG: YIP1 family protein [Prevotellaceae bacterium]|jgi:hypothetical protein|nr:YIP1 family protein [Prevotellaceae bacterium]